MLWRPCLEVSSFRATVEPLGTDPGCPALFITITYLTINVIYVKYWSLNDSDKEYAT